MQMIRPSWRWVFPFLLAMVLLLLVQARPGCALAPSFSPYSDFETMSLSEMDSLRVKLTYGGPQDEPVVTLAFAAPGTVVPLGLFSPYYRSGFDYSNDGAGAVTFTASRQELKALIEGVGTLPDVADGDVDPSGYVSFALLGAAGGVPKAFEAIVNDTTGAELFGRMIDALASNSDAVHKLRALGCTAGMLPKDMPTNVETQVTLAFSGLRADRNRKAQFVGKVKLTNHSGTTIPAPVTLVVIRKGGNANLIGEDGFTCNIQPAGIAFVNVGSGASLGPGMSTELILRFANPSLDKFDLEFRVFAGPGTR